VTGDHFGGRRVADWAASFSQAGRPIRVTVERNHLLDMWVIFVARQTLRQDD